MITALFILVVLLIGSIAIHIISAQYIRELETLLNDLLDLNERCLNEMDKLISKFQKKGEE